MAQDIDTLERAQSAISSLQRLTQDPKIAAALVDALEVMERAAASGQSVQLVAEDEELSTEGAARLLGCSRAYLLRLLPHSPTLEFRMVGSHRRFKRSVVLRFKEQLASRQREGLRALQEDAEALDLGY